MEPAGPWPAHPRRGTTSVRGETDAYGRTLYQPDGKRIVDAVAAIAERRGVPRAQVALACVASRPGVTAPIVGATEPHHIPDALAALDLRLTEDEIRALEEPYTPRGIAGH